MLIVEKVWGNDTWKLVEMFAWQELFTASSIERAHQIP